MRQEGGAALARWGVAAVLAACALSARAGTTHEQAAQAAVADGLTTAVGLAAGAVELNPVGPLLGIGMKYAVMEYAKDLPETQRPGVYAAAASLWQGAAANNACIAASLLSGGAFAPACVVLGVAWGMKTWQDSEHERLFWESCEAQRQAAPGQELICIYVPPDHPASSQLPEAVVQLNDEARP